MSRIVTAYVPIPDNPRSERDYHRLGAKLCQAAPAIRFNGTVEDCWLYGYLVKHKHTFTHSVADNPQKNSLYYHIVQAEKTECLRKAAQHDPHSKVFVWIDYGIFHLPGMTVDIVKSFLKRTETEHAIAIPGCWGKDYVYDDAFPCWRWCGGVMVVPRAFIVPFADAMQHECIAHIEETGNVSWEVNTLARLERHDPYFPGWWYQADHDATMFTNYRREEDAGGWQQVRHSDVREDGLWLS